MAEGTTFRSGFVTLVGRPNTGKSTLLNSLLERKLAIVTHHPQTTRTHLLGVLNVAAQGENRVGDPGAPGPVERQAGRVAQPREAPRQSMGERPAGQIVLVDTPGVHRGRGHLSRAMAQSVRAGLESRDLALYLADVTRPFGAEDQLALDLLGSPDTPGIPPAFLVLNKIDRLARRDELLPIMDAWRQRRSFAEVIPISALRRQNLDTLVHQILAHLPEGPEYFGPGQLTDQPEHFLIAEVIRERAMLATQAEVPHTLAVRIESDESKRQKATPLRVLKAAIYCERPGQKAILVGRGGEMIRRIGTEARQQLEETLGTRVFLELHVLVRNEWRQDPRFVAGLDFRRNL